MGGGYGKPFLHVFLCKEGICNKSLTLSSEFYWTCSNINHVSLIHGSLIKSCMPKQFTSQFKHSEFFTMATSCTWADLFHYHLYMPASCAFSQITAHKITPCKVKIFVSL